MSNPKTPSEQKTTRDKALSILVIGGLAGLALLVTGIVLTYNWWTEIAGGLESWRKHWWKVWLCITACLGGLLTMFLGFQPARKLERSDPRVRRLVYGYNAFLTGILLLAFLGLLNVLAYVRVGPLSWLATTQEWSRRGVHTLSPDSRAFLRALDRPVKVFVLLRTQDRDLTQMMKSLLENCQAITDKLEVEFVSPDRDRQRLGELADDYQLLAPEGVLLVTGTKPDVLQEFIDRRDLFKSDLDPGTRRPRVRFQGENALLTKLNYLKEGKARPIVYFTQGNGELELTNFDTATPDRGLGLLRERIEKGGYEVKELKFGPETDKVPEDAAAVVIVRPTGRYSNTALAALESYMDPAGKTKKKGTLIVLMDVVAPDGKMVETGLEKLLEQFNVQLGNDRIMTLSTEPLQLLVFANPDSQNAIAQAFQGPRPFLFYDARTVNRSPSPPPNRVGTYQVDDVLLVPSNPNIELAWAETNLSVRPREYVQELLQPANRKETLTNKVSKTPLPVAVAVTEMVQETPDDPHALRTRPRMVVFGDATWVSNRELASRHGQFNHDLFYRSLSWARERPSIGTLIEPKDRDYYVMKSEIGSQWRLLMLPMGLLIVGISGFGAAIWMMRRR